MSFLRALTRRIALALVLALTLLLSAPLILRFSVESYAYGQPSSGQQLDAAIVLGASVVAGEPSPYLAARAQEAVELYLSGKVKKILVTGDNGALSHDEVTPVRKYLLAAGIPGKDIFLDHAGFDTYSSMYRASAIFEVRSAYIVTQDFHLTRAVYLARAFGIDAYGATAAGGEHDVFDYLRELPATWKALIDVLLHRKPQYLGPVIPLSGDGQTTWY